MGISAEGVWCGSNEGASVYKKWHNKETREFLHAFYLYDPENPILSSIIHEINECEVNDILNQLEVENKVITPLKKESVAFLHGYDDEVRLSHVISPYGKFGCAMPVRKFRARW